MTTYKRIVKKSWSIEAENGDRVDLKRGEEYITSASDDGLVTVFTTFWVQAPVAIFTAKERFT